MGNMCASFCRCCVLGSVVHPVAILIAVFCVSFVSCIVMMSGFVLCARFLVLQFCF